MYLNCHSYHSLRYGTIPLNELVDEAKRFGIKSLALTDINTITGIYEFKKLCEEAQIKPLVGVEFRQNNKLIYIALAKNQKGIGEMCRLLTKHNLSGTELPIQAPLFENVFVIYPIDNIPETLRDFEFIGIRSEEIIKLFKSEWKSAIQKCVVLQPVTFRSKKEFNLHRILRAIENNTLLSKLTDDDICKKTEIFFPENEIIENYVDYPEILENTQNLIEKCNFEFEFKTPRNKKFYTKSKEGDRLLLENLAKSGLIKRYGTDNKEAKARVLKELKVINDLNFSGYFLITWDIVQYSKSQGFMHVGRGSGANSIVSYCLGITDICPIELDLYFERFLNENRKSPPDFDIDWSWRERDFILDYIFKRFDPNHVAFCGTNVEFKYRSIHREVGKVFGLSKDELDGLSKAKGREIETNSVVKYVREYGMMLEKYPNQRSMHSCGIIISEEPITNFTALEMPPKGFPIVQFDMHVAEDIGFEKFDILSQRGLGTIDEAVKIIEKNRGVKVDITDISLSKNERKCNELLSIGKTLGCFYIESPAMRGLLRRLKCDNYKTLVAASSIIRPGVAQSGMMREYIFRHNHPDKFEYFHEVFKEQLGETYGVMVYQEDVIKIALHYAGLEASYGDILRRAISGKGRSLKELQSVKEQFFLSCQKKGHSLKLSEEVYRQIESFAGYSFCKAHSASYAVESYQSLYLKTYFGIEFMVAAINNGGGFYRPEIYIHEAKMSGAIIHNPCINKSYMQTTVSGIDVYLGFLLLNNLNSDFIHNIVSNRELNGDYKSIEDFVKRVPTGLESIQTLIFIGAFRSTGKTKSQLIIEARMLLMHQKPSTSSLLLIDEPSKEFTFPLIKRSALEDAFDEMELLGFPVSCSPFDLLETKYRSTIVAKNLNSYLKKEVKLIAYLVSIKQVPTKVGMMYFGTWIDIDGEYFDTAHFPKSLINYSFKGGGCYLLLGIVEVDYHFPTITITKMAKMPFKPDPRYSNSNSLQFKATEQLRGDISTTERAPYPQEHEIGLPRYKMENNN
ncbi:DNA polymerase III subunit alpha [Flavobacterium sp. SUN052]|uniref:DNA polymerase III subunit alpha n=1 Tax=Flavobacterium sp. SUN052 TaxID=3002441 RepID=UPI00237E6C93|nr:DNA polymerase III subunit alpha [Flavobacterium sp. SUN052]MEC4005869.1 DNA polymerase III subunit alpha [Flavobacterium sp. SUN052]